MNRISRLRAELRQRRHHPAFRIGPSLLDDQQRAALARLMAGTGPPESEVDDQALADAATNLWRAQRRLAGDGERLSTRERQAGRFLRSVRDALAETGLVVQDHDGDPFHSGRSLEALVFQEQPGLTAETVLETVRPSVYFRDRRIQMGQVIVGSPAPDQAPDH